MSNVEESPGHEMLTLTLNELLSSNRWKGKLIMWLLALLTLSFVGNFILFNYLPDTRVVALTSDGRVQPLPTLDEPVKTDSQVLSWAERKAVALYDMQFHKIQEYPSTLSFLVPEAKQQFIEAITKAGYVKKVKTEKKVMHAYVTGRATLLDKKVGESGRYLWLVEVPVGVVFAGAGDKDKTFHTLRLLIGREHISKTEDDDGIVIASVTVTRGQNPGEKRRL